MELSEGFLNFERKTHSTHNEKTSLLIPKKIVNMVNKFIFIIIKYKILFFYIKIIKLKIL